MVRCRVGSHLGGGAQRTKVVGVRKAIGGVRDVLVEVLVEEALGIAKVLSSIAGVNLQHTRQTLLSAAQLPERRHKPEGLKTHWQHHQHVLLAQLSLRRQHHFSNSHCILWMTWPALSSDLVFIANHCHAHFQIYWRTSCMRTLSAGILLPTSKAYAGCFSCRQYQQRSR